LKPELETRILAWASRV